MILHNQRLSTTWWKKTSNSWKRTMLMVLYLEFLLRRVTSMWNGAKNWLSSPDHFLSLPVTFHRAFDMVRGPLQALETLISLHFDRILIRILVEKASGRIIVVPGGGINERNLGRILDGSGAKEFHCSAVHSCESVMTYRNGRVAMGAK